MFVLQQNVPTFVYLLSVSTLNHRSKAMELPCKAVLPSWLDSPRAEELHSSLSSLHDEVESVR